MQPFINSTAYNNDEIYDIVTDKLHTMKRNGEIREYVEIEDIYINKDGDFLAVEHYYETSYTEEGHGFHTVTDTIPSFSTAVTIIKYVEVLKEIHPEVFYNVYN